MTSKLFASAACATLAVWASCANAQQAAAPAANGVLAAAATAAEDLCPGHPGRLRLFPGQVRWSASLVGKAVNTRLQQLDQQSNAEIRRSRDQASKR